MNQQVTSVQYRDIDDEIDLRELIKTVWAGKWLIIVTTCLFALGGISLALTKPDIYTAQATLAPVSGDDGGSLSKLAGQFGGLASLAGINIGAGGGADKTAIALEVLKSRLFLTEFVHRHHLAVPLMATDGWDREAGKWQYDAEIYNTSAGQWNEGPDGRSFQPTDWDLVKRFREIMSVSESKDSGMVTVTIKSQSPPVAKQWVDWLVADLNVRLRVQDIAAANARIDYLETQLEQTSVAGMQQVFYQLIESETRTVMLANAQPEYVFRTIDPAVVPQESSGPKRVLGVLLSIILGGMLGVFAVFIRAFVKNP
ncbi:Wzz/FepE/Etk N-terminal domain-containing protein [Marinobacter sp. V034]|uniref:Wzz/FepE/Etk N-terminal domain-containing protein n=1 Tax=Marinobacter sp. V034 TaxID=3459610 RepID=UPI00404475C3